MGHVVDAARTRQKRSRPRSVPREREGRAASGEGGARLVCSQKDAPRKCISVTSCDRHGTYLCSLGHLRATVGKF